MNAHATTAPGWGRAVLALAVAAALTGCAGNGEHKSLIPLPWHHKGGPEHGAVDTSGDPKLPRLPSAGSGRGGYYQDDGSGANPPPGLKDTPDAVVRYEPYARYGNKPYTVFGQVYTPLVTEDPFSQRGIASWYGVKFHGQRTSSGEPYDMYKMTAAHPTLPIPSYARVTSLESGKSVVVRINDRGPFHPERVIDVSYTAALKLGLLGKGSHQVQVERLFPEDGPRVALARRAAVSAQQSAPPEIATLMLHDRVQMDSAAVVPAFASASAGAAGPAAATAGAVKSADARSDATTASETQSAAAKAGFYLQLGAFGRAGKAEEMSDQLKKSGLPLALEVVSSGTITRVYSGPYETRAMAQEAARALSPSLGIKPIVVRR